jgi:hypothetical protein
MHSTRERCIKARMRPSLWLLVPALPLQLPAEIIELTPVADTYLREQQEDTNFGDGATFISGTLGPVAGTTRTRAVLKFDLSSVPAGATITNAQLTLTVTMVPSAAANSTFGLHRVRVPWNETNVTWNRRLAPDITWSQPGAAAPLDFSAAASGTTFVGGPGTYTFSSTAALMADAQDWLANPPANHGWLLLTPSEATAKTARHFGARENPGNPPRLRLEYTTGGAVNPRGQITAVTRAGAELQLTIASTPGQGYVVERTTNFPGGWTFATNLTAGAGVTNLPHTEPMSGARGFFRVGLP